MRLCSSRPFQLFSVGLMLLVHSATAQERVFKLSTKTTAGSMGVQVPEVVGNFRLAPIKEIQSWAPPCQPWIQGFNPAACAQALANNENSFLVYRAEQVDEKVDPLKAQVVSLQASVKALADANDALTKRLNDIEARLKKEEQ